MRILPIVFFSLCLLVTVGCQQPERPRQPEPPAPPVWVQCPDCKGTGWKCADGVCNKCKRCDGTGKVLLVPKPKPDDAEGKRRRRRPR